MKHNVLLTSLLIVSIATKAQNIFPTYAQSPRWNVSQWFWEDFDLVQYSYESDTTICGFNYSKTGGFYIRVEGKKVFIRNGNDCEDPEYLMYDFSLPVGQKIWIKQFNAANDSLQFRVDAIDTAEYFGIPRRRLWMAFDRCGDTVSEDYYSSTYWIEGIGSDQHPFFSTYCFCDACETGASLICYDSTGVQLYGEASEFACDIIIPIKEISIDKIQVVPNPAEDQIQITGWENERLFYSVYGVNGVRYISGNTSINEPIRIEKLSSGLYYIQIADREMQVISVLSFIRI